MADTVAYKYGETKYCNTYNDTAEKKYEVRVGWALISQNADKNISTIQLTLEVRANHTDYYTYGTETTSFTIEYNDKKEVINLDDKSFNTGEASKTWKTFRTITKDINHNKNGVFPEITVSSSFKTNVKKTYALTGGTASVLILQEPHFNITIANAYIKNNGEMKLAQAHILKDGQFIPCAVHQKQGNGFVEINLNKANLVE